uniref:Ig-like domain-containing protein n=1 Tax=Anopheles quadriannulatus TaxID=34691 RepID=A0A182WUT0_ANOQN
MSLHITSGGIQPHQPYDGYKSFLDTSTAHLRTYVASGSVASGSSSQFGGVHHAQQQTPGQSSQSKWEEPYFDDTTPRNVTGLVGKSAYLSCRVKNLGNKTILRVPTATIIGGPDLHVDKGSTINLTCAVKYSPEPPAYIFWYHHDEVISYDSSRGGVSVITEKGDVTTSHLLIQNADLDDSGKYSCSPSNADVASVRVHVLNGKCNHEAGATE